MVFFEKANTETNETLNQENEPEMLTSEIISPKIDTTITDEPEPEFSPTKEVRILKPSSFNRDRRRVKEFIQECNVYLDINKNIYKTDKLKVAFVLSLMNEKETGQ